MGRAADFAVGLALPPARRSLTGTGMIQTAVGVILDGKVPTDKGVNGFDSGRCFRGSVQVQADGHLKRRRKPICAKVNSQRDVALAA